MSATLFFSTAVSEVLNSDSVLLRQVCNTTFSAKGLGMKARGGIYVHQSHSSAMKDMKSGGDLGW